MINIDFSEVSQRGISLELLKNVINNQAILLINNFPNDDIILHEFINRIGTPIIDFRSDSAIFDVKVNKRNDTFTSVANSNHYFALHTDCADFETIPNGLAMLCVTPDSTGGDSIFIKLSKVIAHLSKKDIQFLLRKSWLFRNQERNSLTKNIDDSGSYSICYNRIMINSSADLSIEEWNFLDRFDTLLAKYSSTHKLQKNQLMICNNHTVLHGRTAFNDDSARLIKRIRFNFY